MNYRHNRNSITGKTGKIIFLFVCLSTFFSKQNETVHAFSLSSEIRISKSAGYPLSIFESNFALLSPKATVLPLRKPFAYPHSENFSNHRHLTIFTSMRSSSNDGDADSTDVMRRVLMNSWDSKTMGVVPTTPEAAADEAATAIQSAENDYKKLLLIDIFLSSLVDSRMGQRPREGEDSYDELKAVRFCVALAQSLSRNSDSGGNEPRKALVLVRDGPTERSIKSILKIQESGSNIDEEESSTYENEEEDVNELRDSFVSLWDDDDEEENVYDGDDEDYRFQLMSSWDAIEDNGGDDENDKAAVTDVSDEPLSSLKSGDEGDGNIYGYSLRSLFGDDVLSKGPDMQEQAVVAVDKYVFPESIKSTDEEEDIIIILSPCGLADMVAVRHIIQQYDDEKTIILVNSRFNILPRELLRSCTVYGFFPLLARPREDDDDFYSIDENDKAEESEPIKAVVLRRYPRDWEIFLDVGDGNGFELTDTVEATRVPIGSNPSMEFVSLSIQRHLKSKKEQGSKRESS